jgi:hypothetical protein
MVRLAAGLAGYAGPGSGIPALTAVQFDPQDHEDK